MQHRPYSRPNNPTTHHRTQLVLPAHRRLTVLQLAHAVPMAGHMGQAKTAQRILLHLCWPGILADVSVLYAKNVRVEKPEIERS